MSGFLGKHHETKTQIPPPPLQPDSSRLSGSIQRTCPWWTNSAKLRKLPEAYTQVLRSIMIMILCSATATHREAPLLRQALFYSTNCLKKGKNLERCTKGDSECCWAVGRKLCTHCTDRLRRRGVARWWSTMRQWGLEVGEYPLGVPPPSTGWNVLYHIGMVFTPLKYQGAEHLHLCG